jgi:hypothetical protein
MDSEKKDKNVEKAYEEKRKKYNLPKLSEIQSEMKFPLSVLEEDSNMIVLSVRSEMVKRMLDIIRDIESIIAGYDRFCCSIERRVFTREDRIKLFETYRLLQQLFWESRIAFEKDESDVAKWINDFMKAWKEKIKQEIMWYDSKMRDSWIEIKNSETEIKYVG